jgi:hypothetical protein
MYIIRCKFGSAMLEPRAKCLAHDPVLRKDNVLRYITNGNLHENNLPKHVSKAFF